MTAFLLLSVFLLTVFLSVVFIRKKHAKEPVIVNDTLPVYWRYSDQSAMLAYAYLAGWLMRKCPRDPKTKIAFAKTYFDTHFGSKFYRTEEELYHAFKSHIAARSVSVWVNKNLREPFQRKKLIDFLIEMSFSDGIITQMEYVALLRLGKLIGVKESYIEQETTRLGKEAGTEYAFTNAEYTFSDKMLHRKKALSVLGLTDPADVEIIKKTYRELALVHHPDRLSHLSEEERKRGEDRFLQIKEAYEKLLSE